MTSNSRINRLCDNDIARVVERARRNNIHPVKWQVVDTLVDNGWEVFFVEDTTPYERANASAPGRYMFTPVFNPEEADFNGNAR